MKYLPLLLLLAGCESFPEEREEPHFMEQAPMEERRVDDLIEDGIKAQPKSQIDYVSQYTTVEVDVSFFTHRRYMVYIEVMEK